MVKGPSIKSDYVGGDDLQCFIYWCTSAYWFPPHIDATQLITCCHLFRQFSTSFALHSHENRNFSILSWSHFRQVLHYFKKIIIIQNSDLYSIYLSDLMIFAYFKNLPIVQKRAHKASLGCDWNPDHNIRGAASKHPGSSASQSPPVANS